MQTTLDTLKTWRSLL